MKKWLILLSYIVLVALKFCVFPMIPAYPFYTISENCIIVEVFVSTAPPYLVVEGVEELPGGSFLEITGKSVEDDFDMTVDRGWPQLAFGHVTGFTDRYKIIDDEAFELIPIFEAERIYPMMSVAEFMSAGVLLFWKFPLGAFFYLAYWCLPLLLLFCNGRNSRRLKAQ